MGEEGGRGGHNAAFPLCAKFCFFLLQWGRYVVQTMKLCELYHLTVLYLTAAMAMTEQTQCFPMSNHTKERVTMTKMTLENFYSNLIAQHEERELRWFYISILWRLSQTQKCYTNLGFKLGIQRCPEISLPKYGRSTMAWSSSFSDIDLLLVLFLSRSVAQAIAMHLPSPWKLWAFRNFIFHHSLPYRITE